MPTAPRGKVKRTTALGHLVDLAAEADRLATMTSFDWPLREMWIAGAVLDGPQTLDVLTVVVVLDVPVVELPWRALHPAAVAVADALRLPKLPVWWYPRPVAGPAWSAENRQVVRFWDHGRGLDQQVIEELRAGTRPAVVEPSPAEYQRQMAAELVLCRAHLDRVLDGYWEGRWRREHQGFGVYPEDHLWRAAQAVRDLEIALERVGPR